MGKKEALRGGEAEERLRSYFIGLGYFVVRGARVRFGGEDITDIDLWIYCRPSPVSRERANVDAKFRRGAAKALERVLWAKGLQLSLGFDAAIVATTDRRPLVQEYGEVNGVLVLDGRFWDKLDEAEGAREGSRARLSEEELISLVLRGRDDKLQGRWRQRVEESKSRLVTHLGFDACNAFLEETRYFAEQVIASSSAEAACRLMYLAVSYFLLSLDFAYRRLAFFDAAARQKMLGEGFRFGGDGKVRAEQVLGMTQRLIATLAPSQRGLGKQLRLQLFDQLDEMPVEILAEYFASQRVAGDLFSLAKSLEAAAYGRRFVPPGKLDTPLKSVVAVLLDFHRLGRVPMFERFEEAVRPED